MDKHTPGPWFLSPQRKFIRANGAHGYNISAIVEQEPFTEANAKLIAAAPDLLNALRKLVDKCLNSDGYNQKVDELAKAQQAIEKATS